MKEFKMPENVKYPTIPTCLPYHYNSELNGRSGYYPNISSEQLRAVNELIELIEGKSLNFNHDDENEFLKLLRFLRARKFNVQQAFKMVEEDVRWRHEENRVKLRFETAEEVLGCDLTQIFKYFPTWIQGFDKQKRPVSYRKFGQFEIWNVLKLTSMQQLIRFHAWETEQALNKMYRYSKETDNNIETFVLVIDASGWNLGLATSDAFTFIKGMALTDSDHYPERLGTMIIINAPSVLAIAYRVIQGFLDDVQKEKIKIFSTNRNEWQEVLYNHIDKDQIPIQYGGNALDPTPEQAIKSMNPDNAEAKSPGQSPSQSVSDTKDIEFSISSAITSSKLHSEDEDSVMEVKSVKKVTTADAAIQTDDFIDDYLEDFPPAKQNCVIS